MSFNDISNDVLSNELELLDSMYSPTPASFVEMSTSDAGRCVNISSTRPRFIFHIDLKSTGTHITYRIPIIHSVNARTRRSNKMLISGDLIEDECAIPNSINVPLQFGLTFDVDPVIYPECHPHLSITFPNSQGVGIQKEEFLHFLQECCTKLPLGKKQKKQDIILLTIVILKCVHMNIHIN